MPRPDDDDEKDPSFIPSPLGGSAHPADTYVTWEELEAALKDWEQRCIAQLEAKLARLKATPVDEDEAD